MSRADRSLFSRRLLIVTGKGGVGKTTVSAALAVLAARQGIDTVVVEVASHASVGELVCEPGTTPDPGDGRTPVPVSPHLFSFRLVPERALSEYLELQLHVRSLVRVVVGNTGFRRLLDAAPGWRELITLGKLWHLASQTEGGHPKWSLLIVDAPATGHGLSLLSVPHVVLDTVRLGPLRKHTDWVLELIQDPARTLVLPVTLLEELPVKETRELRARVRDLGIALGPTFVNGIEPPVELARPDVLLPALERATVPSLPRGPALREIVEHSARRAALQRRFLDLLADEIEEPLIELPQLPAAVEDRRGVQRLAAALELALASAGVAA